MKNLCKMEIHQGFVSSPLLFTMVLEVLSSSFRIGLWLYADNLVLIAENMEEAILKLQKWRDGMESKVSV